MKILCCFDGINWPLSVLKRCLIFWKCLHWSCLSAVSVPTFVTRGLRGSTATSALVYLLVCCVPHSADVAWSGRRAPVRFWSFSAATFAHCANKEIFNCFTSFIRWKWFISSRLLWRWLLRRHCWLQNDSTLTVQNFGAASPARRALRACAPSTPSTAAMWLEDRSKNKYEIGCSREK